ncbi:multidrug effflux MFS transporter [Coraliomargarita parva]|uniref:multidrug effflux MFS transporter n=1 Tax=Coraliomargarita parva TaxID=3014050 RepID=UPI0022B2CD74|nr:multidrug effflux MFS transporter [Coraliomargarita parva]
MSKQTTPFILTLAMACTMMIGPFSIDTYLPAFPSIAGDLGVELQSISLSISFYIFSIAFSQLIGGALSDRFGRRQVLVCGLIIYSIASTLIASAQNLPMLLLCRVFQAFGAGWVIVSVPALVRDRVSGKEAARLFAMLGFIIILAPGVAPSVGSAFLAMGSWRSIFIFMAGYALLLIPVCYYVIFKDIPTAVRKPLSTGILKRYRDVLSVRAARPYILWQGLAFSILMLFIANASFIYQEHFAQSETAFSLLFAVNIAAMLGFNLLNQVLLSYFDSHQILQFATFTQIVGVVVLLIATCFHWQLYSVVPAMMLTVGSMGAISPNIQACFLEYFPESSGTGAALLGAAQFGISGILSGLSTLLPQTMGSIVACMTVCSVVTTYFLLQSRRSVEAAPTPA